MLLFSDNENHQVLGFNCSILTESIEQGVDIVPDITPIEMSMVQAMCGLK